jgi:hypothetical protein
MTFPSTSILKCARNRRPPARVRDSPSIAEVGRSIRGVGGNFLDDIRRFQPPLARRKPIVLDRCEESSRNPTHRNLDSWAL